MHISRLAFAATGLGFDALTNAIAGSTYNLDPKVNIIIGPNATGKSSLLNMIKASMSQTVTDDHEEQYDRLFLADSSPQAYCEPVFSQDWPLDGKNPASIALPILWIPAQRSAFNPPKEWNCRRDPTHEQSLLNRLSPDALIDAALDTQDGIFRSHYIELARRRLVEAMPDAYDKATIEEMGNYSRFAEVFTAGVLCATEICNDVLEPPRLVDVGEERFYDPNTTGMRNSYVTTETSKPFPGMDEEAGNSRAVRSADQLSAGTSTAIGWATALAFALARHNQWEEGWQHRPAIVLFDEIENQLHPTSQQRVLPALTKHFPGVQVIATTHSPFMATNRESGQVHRLRRHRDGTISLDTFNDHTYGWPAEQIIHELMEVNTQYSDTVAAAAAELTRLTSSPDPSDLARETRIAELRGVINRDLLSSTQHTAGHNPTHSAN